jgi:hypothetical protein
MNRRGKFLFSVTALVALAALLAACGGGGGGNNDGRDVVQPDAGDGGGGAEVADAVVVPDIPGEDRVEPDIPTPPDVPRDVDQSCRTQGCAEFPFTPALNACEEAVCNTATGACERELTPAPECCLVPEDCDDQDEGTLDQCPTPGAACVFRRICTADADCTNAFPNLNACEHAGCGDEGACERVRTPPFVDGGTSGGCCLTAAECDDGDPTTTCTCPGIGGECLCQAPETCDTADDPDEWCADHMGAPGTCAEWACDVANKACIVEPVPPPRCCITAADCNDGNDCTADSCPVIGGACQSVFICRCTENVIPWEATFDSGTLDDLQLYDWDEMDLVTWQAVRKNAFKGYAIYLGEPSCEWYFNGDEAENCETSYHPLQDEGHNSRQIYIELVSPDINLDRQDLAWMVGFWVTGKSQPPNPNLPPGLPQPDTLVVSVEDTGTGALTPVFLSSDYNNDIPTPTYFAADLTAFAGRSVRIHVLFDTFGGDDNRYPGWWLDELQIRTFCGPIQCERNSDCVDGIGCTQDICTRFANGNGTQGVCAWNAPPSCTPCQNNGDCDSGDPCIIGRCSAARECAFTPSGSAACCNEDDIVSTGFDGGTLPAGWAVEHDGSPVRWQVVADPEAGTTNLYFGDPQAGTYDNGADPAFGRVTTAPIVIPNPAVRPYLHAVSTWSLLLSTEFDVEAFDPGVPVDRLTLYAVYTDDSGTLAEDAIWDSTAVEGSTGDEWVAQGVDLTAYAGRTIELVFEFDSDDELGNNHGGAWIDDFTVRTICGSICDDPADCNDGDACTIDRCTALVCENPLAYPDCCTTRANCGPGNACTTVTCANVGANPNFPSAGTCTYRDDGLNTTCCDDHGGVTSVNEIPVQDLPAAGYVIVEGQHGDFENSVFWHASRDCALSDPYGLAFTDTLFDSYQTGFRVSGSVTTPAVSVPSSGAAAKSWLEFELFLDTEWAGAQREGWVNPPAIVRDELRLFAVQGANEVLLWSSFELDYRGSTCPPNEPCDWQTVRIDLTAYQGNAPRLKWVFDSTDDIANAGRGVCIDDIRVVTKCTGVRDIDCFRSEDCDDDDPCTFDLCNQAELFACTFPSTGDPTCCAVQDLAVYNWDTGTAQGWTFTDAVGPVGWTIANFTAADSGSWFLYFGNPAAQNYEVVGQQVSGEAYSPAFRIPEPANVESLTLSFAYYLGVEDYSPTFPGRDRFEVRIIDNLSGAEDLLVNKLSIPASHVGSQPPAWRTFTADIPTSFAGALVSFEIIFDSGDAAENSGLGVLIDTFRVTGEICP